MTGVASSENGGIKKEIGVIPGWAFALAALILILLPGYFLFVAWRGATEMPPLLFQVMIGVFPATILAIIVLGAGYVNRDAGRRGMNRALWTVLVIFLPSAVGFILYFLLRNPIQTNCPKCGIVVDPRVNYCPQCRYKFHPTCPQCQAAVRPGDMFCSNCGAKMQE